jgi:GntR family histidine utilization transcriptional repressor
MNLETRIRTDVEARIRSGEWRPGDRIPFEHELTAQYGCARMTVSKALQALARNGLIERRRKAGSFVAHPHVQSAVVAIPDVGSRLLAQTGGYRFELLERAVRAPRRLSAAEAALRCKGEILVLEGLHHAAAEPFGREHRVISLATVPEAAVVDFSETDPGAWLSGHIPWSDARHRISAVAADAATAASLAVPVGTACLQLERWTWLAGAEMASAGAGITYVRQVYPGDRYDLVAEFKP